MAVALDVIFEPPRAAGGFRPDDRVRPAEGPGAKKARPPLCACPSSLSVAQWLAVVVAAAAAAVIVIVAGSLAIVAMGTARCVG